MKCLFVRPLIATIFLLPAVAFCTERETIRDAHGKVVGTATTDGNKTVYRDAHGKVTGTATTNGNKTTYRDASGKAVGLIGGHVRLHLRRMFVLLVVRCREREVSRVVEHISLLGVDIHLQVRQRE